MSGSETAAQRALAVPELLLHVFLELDNPGNFGRMARLWRQVARDPINLCKHFERRYYPFEILNELLRRPSVYMKVPELVEVSKCCSPPEQLTDGSAVIPVSRCYCLQQLCLASEARPALYARRTILLLCKPMTR